jgi:hypothetical protein
MDKNKKLLLKDICGRLPYKVKIHIGKTQRIEVFDDINLDVGYINNSYADIRPYLFPLSSMTEEQKYDFYCRFIENDCDFNDFKEFYLENNEWHKMLTSIDDIEEIIDWFNKYHFYFRCLIPMGLAIDATGKNIY